MIALALKANGSGTIDFVDANYSDSVQGPGIAFGGLENWSGDPAEGFASFGLSNLINVHIMRSSEFFSQCDARYGYIYLDGDHSYEGCKYDFEQSLKFAEAGALFVFHDVVVSQPELGVSQLGDDALNSILAGLFEKGIAVSLDVLAVAYSAAVIPAEIFKQSFPLLQRHLCEVVTIQVDEIEDFIDESAIELKR